MNGYAIFINDNGTETKLSWNELKLEENGKKYEYDANGIKDTSVKEETFEDNERLKEICIPEGVEYIGWMAFYECEQLEKVILPPTLKEIGGDAFAFTAIKEIVIPRGIERLEDNTFGDCRQLEKVVLPSTLKVLGNAVFRKTAIEKIDIPSSVTKIGSKCFSRTKVKEVILSENVELGGTAFYGCKQLEKITLPLNKASYEEFDFGGCDSLKEVIVNEEKAYLIKDVPEACTVQVKNHHSDGYAIFLNDDGTETKLNWYELKLQKNAEKYGYSKGYYCYLSPGLCEPSITDTRLVPRTFADNKYLKEICFPKSVTYVGRETFSGCHQLEKVILSPNLEQIISDTFAKTAIKEIVIPNSVGYVDPHAFDGCKLEKIIAPRGLQINAPENIIERTNEVVMSLQLSEEEIKKAERGNFLTKENLFDYSYALKLNDKNGERYFTLDELDEFYNGYHVKEACGYNPIKEKNVYRSYTNFNRANSRIKQIVEYSEGLGIKPDLHSDPYELFKRYEKIEGKLQNLLEEHTEAKNHERDNMQALEKEHNRD